MPRDPVAGMNSDGCDFLSLRPHSGIRGFSLRLYSIVRKSVDERRFDRSQVPVQVLTVALQVNDRISNELSGAVERDITPALDLE